MPTLLSPIALSRRPARRTRIVAALLATSIGLLAGALTVSASGAAAPVQAQPASAFRDSIGVQTHFSFAGYPYDTASTDQLAGMLRTLGISHLRDDLCFAAETTCQTVRSRMAAMRRALGPGAPAVDLLALYSRELASAPARATRDADIQRALTAATASPVAPMISGLEAVNEPDLKTSLDWPAAALADDATLHRLLAQPRYAALRGVPTLSPAIGHAENTPALLARGWSTASADVGNFHPYPPAWSGPEQGLATSCAGRDALSCAQALGGASEPVASESGYSTAGMAISTSWVSEEAQAIYLPRLLLENFSRGVARTYLYELIDRSTDRTSAVSGYGLWRAEASGSGFVPGAPKPAALAVARLNRMIGDLGAPEAGGSLELSLQSGGREISDGELRRLLLRRADGSYVLALWQPRSVFDTTPYRQAARPVAPRTVDVTIGGTTTWSVTASRPSIGDAPSGQWTGAQRVSAAIGADVTLLDLRPDGTASTPPVVTPPSVTGAPAGSRAGLPAAKKKPAARKKKRAAKKQRSSKQRAAKQRAGARR